MTESIVSGRSKSRLEFRTQFADAARELAQALRQRNWFDRAILFQRMAVVQTDRLGDDEKSNLKGSDVYAAAGNLMIDANRPAAAMKARRQAITSLTKAMQQSNLTGGTENAAVNYKGRFGRLSTRTVLANKIPSLTARLEGRPCAGMVSC